MSSIKAIEDSLTLLDDLVQSPLDLLPQQELAEKLIHLELQGSPEGLPHEIAAGLGDLASSLSEFEVQNTRVVVLGGGTGLSNIIGGDSRKENWPGEPFQWPERNFPSDKSHCLCDR